MRVRPAKIDSAPATIREILPGVFHWTALHESIGVCVSSYYVEPVGALIDPLVPDDGLDAFAGLERLQQVVLTSAHHARHANRFAAAFGCAIRASREAAQRLGDSLDVRSYSHGDEIAPAITAFEIGKLSGDEGALHVAIDDGTIVFADGLNRYGDTLGFFADELLGDDPASVKIGLSSRHSGGCLSVTSIICCSLMASR